MQRIFHRPRMVGSFLPPYLDKIVDRNPYSKALYTQENLYFSSLKTKNHLQYFFDFFPSFSINCAPNCTKCFIEFGR